MEPFPDQHSHPRSSKFFVSFRQRGLGADAIALPTRLQGVIANLQLATHMSVPMNCVRIVLAFMSSTGVFGRSSVTHIGHVAAVPA
jgi:hypothetical protein